MVKIKQKWWTWVVFGISVMVSGASTKVQIFEKVNYHGLIAEQVLVDDTCITLTKTSRYMASSIKTDECVMLFKQTDCHDLWSYRLDPGEYSNLQNVLHYGEPSFDKGLVAIRKCTETLGSRTLNVDFKIASGSQNSERTVEYRNVCGKVEIPDFASRPGSINAYGSCMKVEMRSTHSYYNGLVTLPGGLSEFSIQIQNYGQPISFLSIEPCDQSYCVILNSTVIKFALIDPGMDPVAKKYDLAMGVTTTFINDGWATVSQEYTATKTYTESTEVTLVKSVSKTNNWKVEGGVEYEYTAGVPMVAAQKIKGYLSTAYTRIEAEAIEEGQKERYEESTQFSVSQKIEIDPCSRYKVDSYIRVTEKLPMIYNVTFEVTGTVGSQRLNASELRERLGRDMKIIGDKDENTVIAMDQGAMYLDFGVESMIDGEEEIIKECLNDTSKVGEKVILSQRK